MKFLRNLLATITGLFVFMCLMIFLFIIIVSSQDKLEKIDDNSVLMLNLNKPISERSVEDPIAEAFGESTSIGILEIKKALAHAKDDEKIKGLYIQQGYFSSGLAKLEELRAAIEDFKESGKLRAFFVL